MPDPTPADTSTSLRRILPVAGFVMVACLILSVVYVLSFRAALDQLRRTGSVELEQAADRLLGQLAPFQQLPNLLARHPTVVGVLRGDVPTPDANEFLANTALSVGADAIYVLDVNGRVVGASDFENAASPLGQVYGPTPYVRRAMSGSLGVLHGIDPGTGARDFFIARGVLDGLPPPVGVVVVRVDVAELEFEWEGDTSVLAFFDRGGVAFVTNRVDLQMLQDPALASADLSRLYAGRALGDMPNYRITGPVLGPLWLFGPNPVLPANALVLTELMPRIDMLAAIFLDTRAVAASARLFTLLAAALLALMAAVLWALGQRRRRLADQLAAEEQANARLEARVEQRTEQLHAAQDQLVQAGKLTALGQMSAGISHELNQPLAAIRNFAENGVKLIARNRVDDAQQNLTQIAEQADRITRIIRNLRAFARNEPEAVTATDVTNVVADTLRLADARARREGITLSRVGPDRPVIAMGGQVRLGQVLLNLVNNAMDAVAERETKRVVLGVARSEGWIDISVRDTGHGIADPDRVFEPFYTTRDIGASKGLGLGLSISYGIIGSFGGTLSCRNTDAGAEFRIRLKAASS